MQISFAAAGKIDEIDTKFNRYRIASTCKIKRKRISTNPR